MRGLLVLMLAALWGVILSPSHGIDRPIAALALAGCIMWVCHILPAYRADRLTIRRYGSALDGMFVLLERRVRAVKRARLFSERLLVRLVPRTGQNHDAEMLATRFTRCAMLLLPACAVFGAWAVGSHQLLLPLCLLPVLVFAAPHLRLLLAISVRKAAIEEEMAFFLCYVNLMQNIGYGLYSSFEQIRGARVFPGFERDASEIVKRVKMIGITQNESLSVYAANHPSALFRDFVTGYLAKVTSVGDVPAYTADKARHFFGEYADSWKRYNRSAQEVFSGVLMVSIILPMMIMFSSLVGTDSGTMITLGMAISPLVSAAMVVVLGGIQPHTGNGIRPSPLGLAGIPAGVLCWVAGVDAASSLAAGFLAGALANHIAVRDRLAAIKSVDSALPEFMRDVTEMSRAGSSITRIISAQAERAAYGGRLGRILGDIAAGLNSGKPFHHLALEVDHSMQVRFVMFLLARTYATGSGSTELFYAIAEFASNVNRLKASVTKTLRPMHMIVYLSPFLMLGISHGMLAVFPSDPAAGLPFSGAQDHGSLAALCVMAVVPSGFVAAKISSYTVFDSLPVAVVSACAMLAIHVVPAAVGAVL